VCGFVAPPDKFQDPDVDMHKQLDLRNNSDLDAGDVAGLNADTNDRDGDGFDDNTGEPIDEEEAGAMDDTVPLLVCPNCGFEAEAAPPVSVSTAAPEGMAPADEGLGAAEGDLCPNCGKAPLMGPDEQAEMGMAPAGEQDPNADPDAIPEEEGQEDDSPFPPKKGDDDEEEDPGDVDRDDDDPEDDEPDPAKKKFPPKKK
jgi:hypothetical protein